MVKRSYSRLFYCLPIALCLFLIPDEIALIRALAGLGSSCDTGYCHALTDIQYHEAVGETIVAALTLVGWLSRWRDSAQKNQRRQAAARGEGTTFPLDRLIPGGDHPSLDLPVTIRLKMAWRYWLLAMGGTALILQGAIVATAFVYHPEPGQYPTIIVALLCDAECLLFLALLSAVFALASRERLLITPAGLHGRWFGLPPIRPLGRRPPLRAAYRCPVRAFQPRRHRPLHPPRPRARPAPHHPLRRLPPSDRRPAPAHRRAHRSAPRRPARRQVAAEPVPPPLPITE